MNTITKIIESAGLTVKNFSLAVLVIFLSCFLGVTARAQCFVHPNTNTALKFSNESSFDLAFFIDENEKGVFVRSLQLSGEIETTPGDHLLRARAVVKGKEFWVWSINEVPPGHICRWTVTDPPRETGPQTRIFNIVDPRRDFLIVCA